MTSHSGEKIEDLAPDAGAAGAVKGGPEASGGSGGGLSGGAGGHEGQTTVPHGPKAT